MNRAPRLLALILPLVLAACSGSPAGPTAPRLPAVAGPTLATLTYTINIPDRALTQQLLTDYPTGRLLSPVAAQAAYDFTEICHGYPNVYYGPLAPANASYYMGAVVVAPYAVASVETFPASAWPNQYGQFADNTTYQWLGRFVYYNCAAAGTY